MQRRITKRLLLNSTAAAAAALAGFAASPALAQDAGAEVQEVVVTGTRIPTPNLESVSPVTSVGQAEIKAQGVARIEDMVNTLPQAFAAQGSMISNGSSGTATVNLRGLGASRTVVLIDGRRLQSGNPDSGATTSIGADLNFIPSALVERVDILTGGASAVYGADAVAGVVNFIMMRDFEGVRLDAQYSTYQHKNDNEEIQSIIEAKRNSSAVKEQFAIPDKTVWDGEGYNISLVMGANSPDGRGNITAYATYLNYQPLLQSERDYSACALNSGATFACGGSGTAYPTRIGNFVVDPSGPGNTFRPWVPATDVYNFGPTNYFQRPDDRYTLGAFARYEISERAEVYADLMFMEDTSTFQIAPGGAFVGQGPGPAGSYLINCDNALMTPLQQQQLCGADAGTPVLKSFTIARRNVEGGGRQGKFESMAYRYVVGLRGELNESWRYDSFLQYGVTSQHQTQSNFFLNPRLANALIARRDNEGKIRCQADIDGTDKACVPYDIFTLDGVTREALDYLQVPTFLRGRVTQQIANVSLVGELPESVGSPMAESPVGVAVGAEYRREHMETDADFAQTGGLLNGAGGANPPVNGTFDVYELFGELRVPLLENAPMVEALNLELAYRFSDYSSVGTTHSYKVAGDWTIAAGYRVRAGYNRAVRAPGINELFAPPNVELNGTVDPCAGLFPGNPLVERCMAAFNLTREQVLALEPDPANQYYGQTGGNPNLDPETADTWTVGLVAQPEFVPGLSVTVDWFDIEVKDFIGPIGQDSIINDCVFENRADYCALVRRDVLGTIRSTQGYVIDVNQNTGGLHTRGVDLSVGYRTGLERFGLDQAGGLSVSFVGTWLDKLEITPLPGEEPRDCAGLYGNLCSDQFAGGTAPNPEWRHKLRVTWNTPFPGDLGLSAQWRHIGSVLLEKASDEPGLTGTVAPTDRKLKAMNYLDLLATWSVRDNYSFRFGVNNVLDTEPPLTGQTNCPAGPCNGNTWPQTYDALGRYIFFGVTADF